MYGKMPKSLGSKRVQITNDQIDEIISVYSGFKRDVPFEKEFKEPSKRDTSAKESEETARIASKVFPTTFFGYRKVTIDRPPAEGKVVKLKKGQKPYDPDLRDTESIPLSEPIDSYFEREVKPHVSNAWVNTEIVDEKDGSVGKVGYEINFNRYFYVYKAPRAPHLIAEEIRQMEKRFVELMKGVVA
jgi:type I restriction enzyme M protein